MSLSRATLEQKIEVLDWYYSNGTKSQLYTVKYFQDLNLFSITKSSFNRWLKHEDELRESYKKVKYNDSSQYKVAPVFQNELIYKCLEFWYEQNIWFNKNFTERELISQYKKFGELIGITKDLNKSNGWCYHFKQKHQKRKDVLIDYVNLKLNFANCFTSLSAERNSFKKSLENIEPQDIFQYEELLINDGNNLNNSSWNFHVGVLINYKNSRKFDPIVVNSSHDVEGPGYYQSSLGKISNEIFLDWLTQINNKLDKKIYIMLSLKFEHVLSLEKFDKIGIIWFNPNLQTQLNYLGYGRQQSIEYQPFYLGIGQLIKMLIKIKIWQIYSQSLEIRITSQQIYQIIQWSLDRLVKDYKNLVISCFEHSGLLPWFNEELKYSKPVIEPKILDKFIEYYNKFNNDPISKFKPSIQQLNQILFPIHDQLINKFYTDVEIIALMKLKLKDFEYKSYKTNTPLVNPQELIKINKFINEDLRNFFNKYGNKYHKFNKSSLKFNEFLNEFLQDEDDYNNV
ncbi:hypothetical protein BN7_2465 [Wickerhamomyces ciferrii]|uniref:HTH CENPB-type domain-containing protein n=1 Tax=Wickerhamomyces ciferrii (strain ATCC 14091 / BCRC 22168 / CBS 111 / JCM 3599 / NBRC 0793 / NRRL Y-1031 F-60-10) TaxID=1206466 RepID=K0KNF1_WICCF|nr:uncharacterized protein BN7_2465 [Wickerhamomyces ciferrii]CCH42919.1 hypothetical protein BN7_2465 [Wickerhamomyces ciferrii]